MAFVDDTKPVQIGLAGISNASPGDFFALLKPRVMSLVVFVAFVGMVLAPGGVNPVLGFLSLLCIAVGAGASGALNMWYDADIDAVMSRTRNRPIPAGRVTPGEALGFGLTLSAGSVALLGLIANWTAAALLAFTIFFYVVIYTMWLKRRTPENIVIGGAAGALPPVVAWAAVTGSVTVEPLILFLIVFMWTPPHFWALSLIKQGDYAKAGVPMLPVVAGPAVTRRRIFIYAVLLVACGVSPTFVGFASVWYGAAAAVLGLALLYRALQVLRITDGNEATRAAGRMFGFTNLYLFLLFAMLLVERAIGLVWSS